MIPVVRRTRALPPLVGLLSVVVLLSGCAALEAPSPALAPMTDAVEVPPLPTPVASGATARLEPVCPPTSPDTPVSAAGLNDMMARVDLPAWQSGDVGASARLSDGRVFWVFGDTVRKAPFEPRMVSNSVLVTSGTCVSQLRTDVPGAIVPETMNRLSQWPMSVVRVPPTVADGPGIRDVVVVYYARVQRGARTWDFIVRGASAAVFLVGEDGVPRLSRMAALTPDDVDPTHIHWGAAATATDEHVYLYGTASTGEAQVYGRELYVSRLPLDAPTDPAATEFWDGASWQADATRAAPVLGATDGVSQMLSVDEVGGRWLAVSKRGGDLTDNVTLWSSDDPYGPWVPQEFPHAAIAFPGEGVYSPMAHPDIPTESGALLVSVSRNPAELETLVTQPWLGRPLFSEVWLG
jgi:hypothetical protein